MILQHGTAVHILKKPWPALSTIPVPIMIMLSSMYVMNPKRQIQVLMKKIPKNNNLLRPIHFMKY